MVGQPVQCALRQRCRRRRQDSQPDSRSATMLARSDSRPRSRLRPVAAARAGPPGYPLARVARVRRAQKLCILCQSDLVITTELVDATLIVCRNCFAVVKVTWDPPDAPGLAGRIELLSDPVKKQTH
jgi:hypothetical protein